MRNKKAVAVLGIGTNLGDKIRNIETAIKGIKEINISIISQSKIYQTPPWGFNASEDFYNLAIKIETYLEPFQLLIELKAIELQMGRQIKESDNYTSRIIDLDIIDYNNTIYNNLDLKIPHPHMSKRNFVLYPLRDIDSHYCNPVTGKKIDELLAELDDESITVVNISK